MIDSDDDHDNFVRYGTALDPIEEDYTGSMPSNKTPSFGSAAKKRYIKLRKANIAPERALTLCQLPWKDLCAQIPGLEDIGKKENLMMQIQPPELKKKKKKKSKAKKSQNYRLVQNQTQGQRSKGVGCSERVRAEEQGVQWKTRDICTNWQTESYKPRSPPNEYESNYRSNELKINEGNMQRDSSQQNYWDTASTSQARTHYQTSRKRHFDDVETISNGSQPPRKMTRDVRIDTNYNRPPSGQQYPMEIEYSPVYSNGGNSQSQAYNMPVQNESRGTKRPYDDNDERYQYHQLYDAENPSLNFVRNHEARPQMDLREEMNNKRRAYSENYYGDQNRLPNPPRQNYSCRGSSNSDCRSVSGSLNAAQVFTVDSDCDDFDARCSREMSFEPHTPVGSDIQIDDSENFNNRVVKAHKFPIKSDKQDDSQSIRVGIQNVTPMNKKQMSMVHQAINKEIVKIGQQGKGPKFLGSAYKLGWILMICEDQHTRKWLEGIVTKLKPWPQASLSLMSNTAFPKSIVLSLLIPSKEGVSIPTALELLRVQNPGLHTEHWKVFKILKVNEGDIVHLSIDNASYEALKLVDFKVNLGIDKLTFWPKGRKPYFKFNKKSRNNISPIQFVKEDDETPASSVYEYEEPKTPEHPPPEDVSVKLSKKARKRLNKRMRMNSASTYPTIHENVPGQKSEYPNLNASYASSEWVPY
ncbi:uncharacterized protein LOC111350873 isoform X1 [Spodoptera litura]|uniref:Uncharacterized protein LOC111350873 isoform X1 n=1 Tax=Spodoptera litura TaxID=69820 RepID=A0A9J7DXZ2_SPOLT|nr:uncharacterized protein LOC111350873 isoform X1 [Spodoptera litura]